MRVRSLLVGALLFLNVVAWGQNKVYWVHGLGDDENTWDTYKSALVPESNQGTSIRWEKSQSLSVATSTLHAKISSEVPSTGKAIVFGHSAGGLIARRAAQINGKIRAVITAGTPNHGADVAKAMSNQALNNVSDKARGKATASLSQSIRAIGSVLPGLGLPICSLISSATDLVSELLQIFLIEEKIEELKSDFSVPAVSDMHPDLSRNAFLRSLNASSPSVPVINLYGKEDDNKLVRIAGTYMHKKENDSPENTADACYDETLLKTYDGVLVTCSALGVAHSVTAAALGVLSFWCPYYCGASAMNLAAAVSWMDTERYIQYDVHNDWDSIIGAVHTESIEQWHRFLWRRWCTVKYVTVYEDSDGFIPKKRSMMDESKGPNTRNYELKGVNHLEMNSHPLMRRRLIEILSDGLYGQEFKYSM